MKVSSLVITIILCTLLVISTDVLGAGDENLIQIAILLDTSSSMNGLIN